MISRHLWPVLLSLGALTVHACRVSRSQLAGVGSLTAVALGAVALSGLTGCSVAGPRQSPLPHDGPTMVDIYRQHMEDEGSPARPRSGANVGAVQVADVLGPPDESLDSRSLHDTSNPLTDRFQRLPNPDLVMHVHAHLADGKYPVPGYVTVFPMYESVQYALPGEVAPRYARTAAARPGDAGKSSDQSPQPAGNAARGSVTPSNPVPATTGTTSAKAL